VRANTKPGIYKSIAATGGKFMDFLYIALLLIPVIVDKWENSLKACFRSEVSEYFFKKYIDYFLDLIRVAPNMKCKVCCCRVNPWTHAVLLNKYNVQYFSCGNCGFIQTEDPYWLSEAYSSAIARSDIGLIHRNIRYSTFCSAVIPVFFRSALPGLDYGGGNGMFTRIMRDLGFEFHWLDKYSPNQFAEGHEFVDGQRYSVVTAFELLEHLVNPLETISEIFRHSDSIIFSTRLLPRWGIHPTEWWYFAPDTGQHISLFSREALELIAKKFGVHLSSNGISLHIMSQQSVPTIYLKAISFPPLAKTVSTIVNFTRLSLLEQDYSNLTGRKLS